MGFDFAVIDAEEIAECTVRFDNLKALGPDAKSTACRRGYLKRIFSDLPIWKAHFQLNREIARVARASPPDRINSAS
jgi:hypothetical protein